MPVIEAVAERPALADGASAEAVIQNRPNAPSGSEGRMEVATEAELVAEEGSKEGSEEEAGGVSRPGGAFLESVATGGSSGSGPPSDCEPYRAIIDEQLRAGLTAQRIYQDLTTEHGFTGKYWSVRRFVAKLRRVSPLPFRRLETGPGEEVQVDFGTGAWGPQREWEAAATVGAAGGVVAFAEGVQRGRVAADERVVRAVSGERVPALWRRAGADRPGQPHGGRAGGGLV